MKVAPCALTSLDFRFRSQPSASIAGCGTSHYAIGSAPAAAMTCGGSLGGSFPVDQPSRSSGCRRLV